MFSELLENKTDLISGESIKGRRLKATAPKVYKVMIFWNIDCIADMFNRFKNDSLLKSVTPFRYCVEFCKNFIARNLKTFKCHQQASLVLSGL